MVWREACPCLSRSGSEHQLPLVGLRSFMLQGTYNSVARLRSKIPVRNLVFARSPSLILNREAYGVHGNSCARNSQALPHVNLLCKPSFPRQEQGFCRLGRGYVCTNRTSHHDNKGYRNWGEHPWIKVLPLSLAVAIMEYTRRRGESYCEAAKPVLRAPKRKQLVLQSQVSYHMYMRASLSQEKHHTDPLAHSKLFTL
jgi:hypothetical protein